MYFYQKLRITSNLYNTPARNYKELKGKNIAVITHAGGSAVMLRDSLSSGGLQVPAIEGPDADKLQSFLHPGSAVSNPIDFLATGTGATNCIDWRCDDIARVGATNAR